MPVIFGKSFTTSFTVHDSDGGTIAIDSIVSGRIYTTVPTEAQKEDSDESEADFAVVMSSSQQGQTNEYLLTYPALTDTDEHASSKETYYEVISFKFESGGAVKFVSRPITVIRPNSMFSRIATSSSDMDNLNAKISALKGSSWVTNKITLAVDHLLNVFEGRGYFAHLIDQKDLDDATLYWAACLACLELSSEDGDVWLARHAQYLEVYNSILNKYAVGIDANADGNIDTTEVKFGGPIMVER